MYRIHLTAMPFVDPKNLRRPLALAEILAMIARGEADANDDAGRVSGLDELLPEWEAEDQADRPTRVRSKPSAA